MWDLPRPGIKHLSPTLASGLLTTGPPGKSLIGHYHSLQEIPRGEMNNSFLSSSNLKQASKISKWVTFCNEASSGCGWVCTAHVCMCVCVLAEMCSIFKISFKKTLFLILCKTPTAIFCETSIGRELESKSWWMSFDEGRTVLLNIPCSVKQVTDIFLFGQLNLDSVQFCCSVMSDTLWPHESQHCPSLASLSITNSWSSLRLTSI